MRLIDADALKKILAEKSLEYADKDIVSVCMNTAYLLAINSVHNAPTVDAVPVVRCGECVYWESGENEAEKWECCLFHHIDVEPHSFCSYGERRKE